MTYSPTISRLSILLAAIFTSALTGCTGGGECDTAIAIPPPPGTGGFGNFSFELRQDVSLGGLLLTGAEWADFNQDSVLDVAEIGSHTDELFIGTGLVDGTYVTSEVLPTPSSPWSLAVGDYNGDGLMDIAVGCLADTAPGGPAGQLALYLQGSLGGFALTSVTPLIGEPLDISRLELGASDLDAGTSDDLLVALSGSDVVQQLRLDAGNWLLMTELRPTSGGFESATPFSLAVIDLEADGDLDILVGEIEVDQGGFDRVVSYTNDGLGGFLPASMVLPTAFGPVIREAGDVDQDGFDDLSVAQLSGTSSLLLRGAPGGLLFIEGAEMGGAQSSCVWRDLDKDGLFDVAASMIADQAIAVRFQDELPTATGTTSVYTPVVNYNVGLGPHGLSAADFQNDGLTDLACINSGDISLLYNLGDRNFLAARGYSIGEAPHGVLVADLDQDGHMDAITVDKFQKHITFLQGSIEGTFEVVAAVPLALASTETPGHALIRDFDEDGKPDVLVSVFETGEVQLLRNPGSMLFTIPSPADRTTVGTEPLGLDAADFNADGHWDVLVSNSGDGTIQVLIGDGTGAFTASAPVPMGGTTYAAFAGDLDGNGASDAVITMTDSNGQNPRIAILEGDAIGGLSLKANFPLGSVSATIQSGDLNLDGFVDLIFGQSTLFTDEISILTNLGDFTFDLTTLVVGASPGSLSIADVDGDGDEDIVIPVGSGELRIALGDGTGGFSEVVPLESSAFGMPVPYGTSASAFADLNQDGLLDLLMVSPYSDYLWVARNLGTPLN
jgi:hypothetical protein